MSVFYREQETWGQAIIKLEFISEHSVSTVKLVTYWTLSINCGRFHDNMESGN